MHGLHRARRTVQPARGLSDFRRMSRLLIYQKTLFACTTVLFAAALIWAFRGNNVPVIPDEIGYLSIARYLVTGEAMNIGAMPAYRFGQGLLLTPGWIFDPARAYQIGVAASCISTALVPIFLVGIAQRLEIAVTPGVIVASFLVAAFPAYFYQNSVVWPETTFRLLFVVLIYLVASAWSTRRSHYWIASAAALCALYWLHPRALGILPVFALLLMSAHSRKKAAPWAALASIALVGGGLMAFSKLNSHFLYVLWGRTEDVSQIGQQLDLLLTPSGVVRFLVVVAGHAWAQIVASFGLYVAGLVMAWQLFAKRPSARPVLIFALGSCLAVFAASSVQMVIFSRVDHVIYSRYNDGVSTFFVWLGILMLLSRDRSAWAAPLILATLAVTTAVVWVLAGLFSVAGLVAPNLPALIWVGSIVPLDHAGLKQMLVIGTICAFVGVAAFSLSARWAFALLAIATLASDLTIRASALAAHRGRESYIAASSKLYRSVSGSLFIDRSAATDLHTVIDEYASANRRMPWSDIASTDINQGDATVVSKDVSKPGYTCIGRLPSGSKLLKHAPGPDDC